MHGMVSRGKDIINEAQSLRFHSGLAAAMLSLCASTGVFHASFSCALTDCESNYPRREARRSASLPFTAGTPKCAAFINPPVCAGSSRPPFDPLPLFTFDPGLTTRLCAFTFHLFISPTACHGLSNLTSPHNTPQCRKSTRDQLRPEVAAHAAAEGSRDEAVHVATMPLGNPSTAQVPLLRHLTWRSRSHSTSRASLAT